MSLMGTLGKVAVGMIVAKGVGSLMNKGGSTGGSGGLGGLLGGLTGAAGSSGSGGLGGLLGGLAGGQSGGAGGLGGLLGSLTGQGASGGGSAGGLGGLLGSLTGQGASAGGAGGLGGLLGGLAGQGGAAGGGLGGLLNSLGGGTQGQSGGGSFGDLFNSVLQGNEPEVSADDEKHAALLLRAMISAAKADGHIDEDEQKKVVEHLGDITEDEANFVRQEMQAPLDLPGLIASVPQGMGQQVYLMSLLGITLDKQEEAVYLDRLAKGLGLSQEACNEVHDQLGAPRLYS